MGKTLLIVGLVVAAFGGVLLIFGKVPFLGKLPGDIKIEGKDYTFYFPVMTCVVMSIVLSLIFWIVSKFK